MKQIGEFCGKVPPRTIETNSSSVDVTFLTDESGYSRGWKISYTIESNYFPSNTLKGNE